MLRRAIGSVILAVAVLGLGGNEWLAGRSDQAVAALRQEIVYVDPAGSVPTGVPVLLTGRAVAGTDLADPPFPVRVHALRLDRIVEMLQWRETVEGSGQDRVARHEKVWSTELIDSRRFLARAPVNPAAFPLAGRRLVAGDARLGGIVLGEQVLERLPATETIPPLRRRVAAGGRALTAHGDFYWSGDPERPEVGDIRVRHVVVPEGPVTAVGSVRDGVLGAWMAPNGTAILLADLGPRDLDMLIRDRRLAALPAVWGARFAFGILALVGTAALWPALTTAAPGLAAALGGRAGTAAPVVALALVALAVLLGWLVFRTPLGWP